MAIGVVACGGGSDDDDPANASDRSAASSVFEKKARLSLSDTKVRFKDRYEDKQNAPSLSVEGAATGTGIVKVVATIDPAGKASRWLHTSVSGKPGSFVLRLNVVAPAAVGLHTAVVKVIGLNKDKTIAVQKTLRVDYKVLARLAVNDTSLSFDDINGTRAPAAISVAVQGLGLVWHARTTNAWIQLGNADGIGPGAFSVNVNPSALAAGAYQGKVKVYSNDGQVLQIDVAFALKVAALKVSKTTLAFGGANGRSATARTLSLQLNTGAVAHGWTLKSLPAWLHANVTQGTVSGTAASITLTPDLTAAAAGTSTATIELVASVNGDRISRTVNVQLTLDEHRLYAEEDGVAFVDTPQWSRLTRNVKILDNFDRATPWTASSDQTWLSVTANGAAGDSLTFSANPGALPSDSVAYATVTLTSTDASVVAPRPIRVALWKGSTAPASVVSKMGSSYEALVADPIRPFAYVHSGGTSIDVYNVYLGTKVASIDNVANALGTMTVSSNGDTLYAIDGGFKRIAVVDLASLTKTRVIAALSPTPAQQGLLSMRSSGVELLVVGDGSVYRAGDGQAIAENLNIDDVITASGDGKRIFTQVPYLSPAAAWGYQVDYAAFNGGTLLSTRLGDADTGSNARDIAANFDGSIVYTADGYPYQFATFQGSDMSPIGGLPEADAYPNNVQITSDDRVIGGISGAYATYDIWVYNSSGAVAARFKVAGYAQELLPGQLVASGDAMMIVALTDDPGLHFIPLGP